jgi:chromosome segregation ATPase
MNPDNTQNFSASDSEKLSLILTGVQSLAVRFDNVDARFNNFDSRLLHVEQTVNELRDGQIRLHETVLQIKDGQRQLQQGQDFLGGEVHSLKREVSERLRVLSGATNAEIKELDKRVTRLELERHPPDPQT